MNNSIIFPNLIIPGFPKSGTSSLHQYLCQHPEIIGGKAKEPHFYSNDQRFFSRFDPKKKFNLTSFFPSDSKAQFFIDASTSYMISDTAIERILFDNPTAKFLVIARDPIERIVSHYKWLGSHGVNLLPFKDEVIADKNSIWNFDNNFKGYYKYFITHSSYGSQLTKLHSLVPKENIYFVKYEVFFKDPENEIKKIFKFLALDEIDLSIDFATKNITKQQRLLPDWLKRIKNRLPRFGQKVLNNTIEKLNLFSCPIPSVDKKDLSFFKDLLSDEIKILESLNIDLENWNTTKVILEN